LSPTQPSELPSKPAHYLTLGFLQLYVHSKSSAISYLLKLSC